jgi:hypothetical protein
MSLRRVDMEASGFDRFLIRRALSFESTQMFTGMAKLEVRLVLRCDGVEVIYTHKELGGRSVQIESSLELFDLTLCELVVVSVAR